jgi:hypothetical protein
VVSAVAVGVVRQRRIMAVCCREIKEGVRRRSPAGGQVALDTDAVLL